MDVEAKQKTDLSFIFTQIGRWWDKYTEVDIIASNEDKSKILSTECKFHNNPISDADLQKHIEKDLSVLKKRKEQRLISGIFLGADTQKRRKTMQKKNKMHLVTGENLFDKKEV